MKSTGLAAAVLCGMLACGTPPGPSPRKESIARLPAALLEGSITVTADGKRHAYLVRDGRNVRMVIDGVPGPPHTEATNRSFAPGSRRHFYWARDGADRNILVTDGQVVPVGYSRHEYVVFDPGGSHWALLATAPEGGGAIVVADGETAGPFADAAVPAWSPRGRLAYLRAPQRDKTAAQPVELVVDGVVIRRHEGESPTCLPAMGDPHRGPEMPRHFATHYLADESLLAVVPQDGRWVVLRDGDAVATYDASAPTSANAVGPYALSGPDACASGSVVAANSFAVAEQAPVAAWWERAGGAWRVVVDGTPVAEDLTCLRPWPTQPPLFTPDGQAVAYPCVTGFDHRGEAIMIVHGTHRYGPYPEVHGLAISDDGRHLAYGASNADLTAGWAIFADGRRVSPRYYATWRPRFDASGRHLGWEAMATQRGPNLLLLDGRRMGTFDELINGPFFDRTREVGWIVRRGSRLVRLNFPTA